MRKYEERLPTLILGVQNVVFCQFSQTSSNNDGYVMRRAYEIFFLFLPRQRVGEEMGRVSSWCICCRIESSVIVEQDVVTAFLGRRGCEACFWTRAKRVRLHKGGCGIQQVVLVRASTPVFRKSPRKRKMPVRTAMPHVSGGSRR